MDTLPDGFADLLGKNRPSVGDVVAGHYRILELLGEGAMGTVFVAENVSIGLRVALKLLKPELIANPEFRHRFQKEAEAVAAVNHPNVVRFLDLVVGDPTFLVMEFVPGESLTRVLRREKRFSIERAVGVAQRLCWALEAVHAAGVVHRDLKPANVMIAPDPELGETPKLIDFGLAKIAAVAEGKQLTRAGQLIGTPHYMPPEQITGQTVDPRTDVYALGCVLYEMISGEPPFPSSSEDIEVLYRHMYEPAPPMSSLVKVSPALDSVLARSLEKNPDKRFASMRELATALSAAMASPAPEVRAARVGSRLWPALAGAALATAVTLLAVRRAPPPVPTGNGQLVLLATRPSGAAVEVDGRKLAETTPTVASGLAPGRHTFRFSRAGAAPTLQVVDLAAGQRSSLDIALPPASRDVEIQSIPSGAQVYVDGRLLHGATPLRATLTDDDFHEVRVEKIGYEPLVKRITPDDRGAAVEVELQSEREARGTLSVDANRAVDVWIDGAPTSFVTPTIPFLVKAGDHVVEVRDSSGARAAVRKVHVSRGEAVRLTLDLTPTAERRNP